MHFFNNLYYFLQITSACDYIIFSIFYYHFKCHILNMVNVTRDINQQDLKIVDLHFAKSE